MKDYERINQYPYIIYKINQEYHIIDERIDMVWGIYKNKINAIEISSKLNENFNYKQEFKL